MSTDSTKLSRTAVSFLACSLGGFLSLVGYYSSVYLMFCTALPQSSCLQFLHNSDIWWIPLFVGSVGALAGLLFPLLQDTLQSELDRIIGGLILVAFVCFPWMLWISNTVLWPTFMERYPSVAYRQADLEDKWRIYLQVLANTRVGDTIEILRATLPQKFGPSLEEDHGFHGRQFYAVKIKQGIVSSVQVDPLPRPGPSPTRITYIFPAGFRGWATICYATPEAAPLPIEGRHMTIKFPTSGVVVTSTAPSFGGYVGEFFLMEADGPRKLHWFPKANNIGLVTQHFGSNTAPTKERTLALRMAQRTFVGTNTQMKNTPASQGGVHRCPPGIVRTY